MTVQINEVWNREGRSVKLAIIQTTMTRGRYDVLAWIAANRPDLSECYSLNGHGFHAVAL